jgi:hypothetical protein
MEMEWVLNFRHEALTPIFLALTFLGDPTFFLLVLPLGYWVGRREAFFRLTVLLVASAFLNSALKGYFEIPRPTTIPHLVEPGGWSFPSGHAQIAAVMWAYLAWELRQRWFSIVAAMLIVGVSVSRVYLGVHRPVDIFVGATIGLVTVALVRLWFEPGPSWWTSLAPAWRSAAVVIGTLVTIFVLPGGLNRYTVLAGGLVVGFWVGAIYERRHIGYTCPTSPGKCLAVALVGLAGAFVLRFGLKAVLAPVALGVSGDLLRYLVIGAWISLLAPWLFRRLGWSGSKG